MRRVFRFAPLLSCVVLLAPVLSGTGSADLPVVLHNDNIDPAGTLRDGVLELRLEIVRAAWHPLGAESGAREVFAFAEEGKAPAIPGPLVRVPAGTRVRVRITSRVEHPMLVLGLTARTQGDLVSRPVAPGATIEAEFEADAVGTYYYRALRPGVPVDSTGTPTSLLSGALIVDPAGARGPATDRVFVIGLYVDALDEDGAPDVWREFLVINGRPWPYTERLDYAVGDSIRWRVINATGAPHPMHLHGFYYRVDARGDIAHDTIYWPRERRMVVTELLNAGATMAMTWSPDRPGGWVFHCHLSYHVIANPILGPDAPATAERERAIMEDPAHDGDPHRHVEQGMGGLMMAIRVAPPAGWKPEDVERRELRLFIQTDSAPGEHRRYGYVLQDVAAEPAPDSVRLPGSTIVLKRGEPTRITVVNRTAHPTAVHWHGLELESFFDGVTGVGGYQGSPTPAILPGDAFAVHITPPRAGSFMYHTHVNDIHQQSHGLYGPFVVVEPDAPFDPSHDVVLLVGPDATDTRVLLNGATEHPPLEWKVGETYRLRFMNITLGNPGLRMRLARPEGQLLPWDLVAKDGWTLPAPVTGLADQRVSIGETFDFEFTPAAPGQAVIEVRSGNLRLFASQPVRFVR